MRFNKTILILALVLSTRVFCVEYQYLGNWTVEDELDCIDEISIQYEPEDLEPFEYYELELECIHWYQEQ